jgi:deazaflavin-dependent oxidoreductase (nitroreductase family)
MAVELTPNGTYGVKRPNMPRALTQLFAKLNVGFYRLVGHRMRVQGAGQLLLATVGSKSGKTRRSPLGWFADGENAWLIVASAAGSAKHPAWYFNMARNPDKVWIDLGKRTLHVRPQSLKGAEREDAWQRIIAQAPGYAAYRTRTDREIPIVRLTLVDETTRPDPA